MRFDILSRLELLSDQDWLWYFDSFQKANVSGQINDIKNYSADLSWLTKRRIEQILSIKKDNNKRLKIVIAEAQPLEFLATFLAGVIIEADVFLCDPDWQQQEWQQVADIVRPDLVFGRTIKNLTPKLAIQNHNFTVRGLIMIPTGGTSGKIKFAIHSWSSLSASVKGFQTYFGCQKINSFCTLPLYHVSGLMQFMRSLITSGKIIICPYKILKDKQQIINLPDYFISLVPTQLQLLIDLVPDWLAKFKTVLLGGAPATRSLLEQARRYQIPLALTYGMTETASGIVTLKPEEFLDKNNSSGQVLSHAQITINTKINSQENNRNIGLIQIKSDSLCWGYYPQFFDKKCVFATDDLGYFDDRGYLYLIGRNSHKIITGGENVYPTEIEEVILATNLVKDVCIVGTSDRYWGQAVTAVYVPLATQPDLELIKTAIASQLAKYKQPKYWISIDRLPRNNRGKLNYQTIQEFLKNKLTNN